MAEAEVTVEETTATEEDVTDLSSSDVVTKYQDAANIANLAMQGVIKMCVADAQVGDICKFGDTVIKARCDQIYKAKVKGAKVEKGAAFPTCISVNECVCHNNPLESEANQQPPLKDGDWVKIDLGCHIDGYIAMVAHTVKVGNLEPTPEHAITVAKEADVMLACYKSAELAARLIKPGNTNTQVTEAIQKVAEAYGVNFIMATLMHQIKRYVIGGSKVVNLRADSEQKVEEVTFEANEVYVVDVAVSSGEGKPREQDTRTTVFKRSLDKSYMLKMKASRYLFKEVNKTYPTLPFCLRALDDERTARMGVLECLKHELITPYPVLWERPGDLVAHIKFTILLLPTGTSKITGVEINEEAYLTAKKVDEETAAILAQELGSKKKKKKNKKKKKAGADDEAEAGDAGAAEEEDAS